MARIIIVEDEDDEAAKLENYILQFGEENGEKFEIKIYRDGLGFIGNYEGDADVVFMDIKMKNVDGLEAARGMRKTDAGACLVFVTNMAQYAIKGYEVDALGFMVKPVSYFALSVQLKKALARRRGGESEEMLVKTDEGVVKRISLAAVYYVEVIGHFLTYHTAEGDFRAYGQLSKLEKELADKNFYRCQNSYLINLKYVTEIKTIIPSAGRRRSWWHRRGTWIWPMRWGWRSARRRWRKGARGSTLLP